MQLSPNIFSNASSDFPIDAVSHTTALRRLLRAGVRSEEQLSDYGLSQAFRGLTFTVKRKTAVPISSPRNNRPVEHALQSSSSSSEHVPSMAGREAVLYAMATAALNSVRDLQCLVYLSARMLTDGAAGFGEGNERPCCTEEWGSALLSYACLSSCSPSSVTPSALAATPTFSSLIHANRRFQLGYLLLAAGTLRTIVSDPRFADKHVFSHHVMVGEAWCRHLLPSVARIAEGTEDQRVLHPQHSDGMRNGKVAETHSNLAGASGRPSRLTVEANHFIIYSMHWICADVIATHHGVEGTNNSKGTKVTALDRDAPLCVWSAVTLLRNALCRAFAWVDAETASNVSHSRRAAAQQINTLHSAPLSGAVSSTWDASTAPSFAAAVSRLLDRMFSSLLKHQELLSGASAEAERRYGAHSKDYQKFSDAQRAHTFRACLFMRNVTGAWMHIHGGLDIGAAAGLFLPSTKDILAFIATCVTRVPQLETKESEVDVFLATDALLTMAVAAAAAAPSRTMQGELWASALQFTQEIHNAIVQRALRFRDEHVLKLASLLTGSILYASSGEAASQFTADSSEQLLELLSSERDAASHCVVEMLTRAVVAHPHSLIPALFRIMQHGNVMARRNALDVLAGLPRLGTGGANPLNTAASPPDASPALLPDAGADICLEDNRMRNVLRILAEQLLLRLSDEELCVRMQSASLFAKVWPEDVLLPLLNLSVQKDSTGRKQAVVKTSLSAVVEAHTDSADIILLLIQYGYDILYGSLRGFWEDMKRSSPGTGDVSAAEPPSVPTALPPGAGQVPTTPGDVLSYALLRSTDALGEASSTSALSMPPESQGEAAPASLPLSNATERNNKSQRLVSVIEVLCDRWVRQVRWWESRTHVRPLLQSLALVMDSEVERVEKMQWGIKMTTHVLSCITVHAAERGPDSDRGAVLAVISAIGSCLLNLNVGEDGLTTEETAGTWAKTLEIDSPTVVYKCLAPLLCLRCCSRHAFAFCQEDASRDGLANRECRAWLLAIWSCLWQALLGPLRTTFFVHHRELQRVLLESIVRFPASLFFSRVNAERSALRNAAAERAARSNDVSQRRHTDFFLARVTAFGVCSFASALPTTEPADHGAAPASSSSLLSKLENDDLLALQQNVHILNQFANEIVLPWLLSDQQSPCGSPEVADSPSAEEYQRLSLSIVDAVGLLTLLSIVRRDSSLWEQCSPLSFEPLAELASFYRSSKAAEDEHAAGSCPPSAVEDLLGRFQFCVHIQKSIIAAACRHPQGHKLLVSWLEHFTYPMIELSNACCAALIGRASHDCQVAVQCGELLFQAVMHCGILRRNAVGGAAGAATRQTQNEPQASVQEREEKDAPLQHLPLSEKAALVQFSIGCVRYASAPLVQHEGVKLVSALLGSAPQIFAEVSEGQRLTALDEATSALRSVALMHPNGQTRLLAEQVLGHLPSTSIN